MGLVVKNVTKAFGNQTVLDSVSIEVEKGQLLVLLGPSGCGKTTLLRLIAGLVEVDRGEVYIENRRVDHLRPKDRNVAMVFQNYSLYPHMTVEKNLAFPLKVASVNKTEIKERVESISRMLGLSEKLRERPGSLSGGQRQRVALGRAVIRKPSLFLLDEPLSNLDADLRGRMRREIVRMQKELGVTTVYVTHDQTEALTMADNIAVINEGKIVQVGSPQELYRNPKNLFVARFIGIPKINIIEAKIERHLLIPFGISLLNENLPRDRGDLLLGLRPEAIEICTDGEFVGHVENVEYYGDQYVTTIKFKDHQLVASNVPAEIAENSRVNFTINSATLLFFDTNTGERISGQS